MYNIRKFKEVIAEDSIILICVIRDEELLLPYFINHYKRIGVSHFIFIDNGSIDGTIKYILQLDDVNYKLYSTNESYAQNNYGVSWVNKILDKHCKDRWCLTVDIDELLTPPDKKSLLDIRLDMENSNSNITQTCLVDFYPSDIYKEYAKGSPFISHSDHFDSSQNCESFYAPDTSLTIKGGSRQRLFNFDSFPCLTKRSFFKYDFYNTHECQVGYHWILPKTFESWASMDAEKWINSSPELRFTKSHILIKHFKFIKPDLKKFFNTRVSRNEDWDNSSEYKSYLNSNIASFLHEESIKYKNDKQFYDDFNLQFLEKNINLIITGQRHGSTTLCEKIDSKKDTVCLFEAISQSDCALDYLSKCGLEIKTLEYPKLESFLKICLQEIREKNIFIKVIPEHIQHEEYIDKILKSELVKKIIILRRDLSNAYKSYEKSITTGNWGTTPKRQVEWGNQKGWASPSKSRDEWKSLHEKWFKDWKESSINNNIESKQLRFHDVIQEDFSYE